MNYLFAGIKDRKHGVRRVITDVTLFELPENLNEAVPYSPSDALEEGEWFCVADFSTQIYCFDWLKNPINPMAFSEIRPAEYSIMDYFCAYQSSNEFYFQKLRKRQLIKTKKLFFGEGVTYDDDSMDVQIQDFPDALYIKNDNKLYFRNLSTVASIFKGMEELYRIATEDETQEFLNLDFIHLSENYKRNKVSKPNRKRIAMALDSFRRFDEEQKASILGSIYQYAPGIVDEQGGFAINTEDDLQALLWGINQRYYTTADGRTKLIASSVRNIPEK